jgi:hypothetical protein
MKEPLDLQLTNEESLLIICSMPADDAKARAFHDLAASAIDWELLISLAQKRSIFPLLYRRIIDSSTDTIPESALDTLRSLYHANSIGNYLIFREMMRIITLFRNEKIPVIPLKGPLLAHLAYGDIALRIFCDIDLLVPKPHLVKARDLLFSSGYSLAAPMDETADALHRKSGFEYELVSNDGAFHLELRWELSERSVSFNFDDGGIWNRVVTVPMPEGEVTSLSAEDHLLYLCIHGTKHFFSSFKWVVDIAKFLSHQKVFDWDWITKEARRTGNERMLLIALSVTHVLLDSPIPPPLLRRIEGDRVVDELTRLICHDLFTYEQTPRSFMEAQRLNIRMRERLIDRIRYFVHIAINPNPQDAAFLPLPRHLSFLYFLVRPFRQMITYLPMLTSLPPHRKVKRQPETGR